MGKNDDEINEYLTQVANSYQPKVSEDPDDNECTTCTMSQTMHEKYPKNTCGNFTQGEIEMTEKSDLKILAEEIREININNKWNVWKQEDFRSHLPDTMQQFYDEVVEKINDYLLNDENPPAHLLYIRDDLEKLANRMSYKFPTICALITSEVSEALEAFRQKDKRGYLLNDKIMTRDEIGLKLGAPSITNELKEIKSEEDILDMIKEEMADVLIRVLDWWSAYDDDPMETVQAKLEKNRSRGARHGGKSV